MKFWKYLKSFMNTPDEWHSFVIGLCEGINPLKPYIKADYQVNFTVNTEYHYYAFGRALGLYLLMWTILAFFKLGLM